MHALLAAEADTSTWIDVADRLLDNGLGVFFAVVLLGFFGVVLYWKYNPKTGTEVIDKKERRDKEMAVQDGVLETQKVISETLTSIGTRAKSTDTKIDDLTKLAGEAKDGDANRDQRIGTMASHGDRVMKGLLAHVDLLETVFAKESLDDVDMPACREHVKAIRRELTQGA